MIAEARLRQRLYAAFGCGDVEALLVELADDVDWAAEGALRPGAGRARRFSEVGDRVVVEGHDHGPPAESLSVGRDA